MAKNWVGVNVQCALNDTHLDAQQPRSQRQLAISIAALPPDETDRPPLNLCLILDRSGSMTGRALDTVKAAVEQMIGQLQPRDRLAIVAFDHAAEVVVANQEVGEDVGAITKAVRRLGARGGTAIDEGMRLGIEELAKGRSGTISQAFLLTDGENEHGDNDRCLKFAELAASYTITLNCLGFGRHWNQDVLEQIADAGSGTLSYIAEPAEAADTFDRLLSRVQTVQLTNAHLLLTLPSTTQLADFKPLAQVAPETIELQAQPVGTVDAGGAGDRTYEARLGDLMIEEQRVVLANLYIQPGLMPAISPGVAETSRQTVARVQVRYDDPARSQTEALSEAIAVDATVQAQFQPAPDPQVQTHIYALAKYRQTQIAETKLKAGDRKGAATLLQAAATTALQMGDQGAATVLQTNATRLQAGDDLSEEDRKRTRIVSKTTLQAPPS